MKSFLKMMHKLYKLVFSKTTLYILLFLSFVFWAITLHNRFIENDEAILGEYSYHFLKEGVVRLKTIPLILDWDERVFGHHRFFTWYGAGIIQVFGWSITALKSSIIPFYGLFFFLLFKYFRLEKLEHTNFLVGALLIITCPILILKSFSFRPDIILMTEGLAILYFIRRYRIEQAVRFAAIAGAIAGLAFLTHLNGMAFCIAGFFFLLIRKEYKALLGFVVTGAMIGGVYFIELIPGNNFERFIYELTNWPTVNHGENYIGGGAWGIIEGRVTKLLSEHQRFFWGDTVIAFSALFFSVLLFSFKTVKKQLGDVLLFMLLLVLSLNLFGSHVAERYLLFYYGPMAIITAFGIVTAVKNRVYWKLGLFSLIFLLQLFFASKILQEIRSYSYPTVESHQAILSKIPNETKPKILAPCELIFNEFPNYDLYSFKTYEYLQEDMEGPMTHAQLFQQASDLGMKYIIINDRMARYKDNWFYQWQINDDAIYRPFFKNERYVILKKI